MLTNLEKIDEALKSIQRHLDIQTDDYKTQYELAKTLFEALRAHRFSFSAEQWYCTRDVVKWSADGSPVLRLPQELLLRAETRDGELIPPGPAIAAFVEFGLARLLDLFLLPEMIAYAREHHAFPISVNISASAATSDEFWEECLKDVHEHLAKGGQKTDVVFEIERAAIESEAGRHAIAAVRREGFLFAIDDFYSDDFSDAQTHFISRYIDFIKFTGPAVQQAMEGKYNLEVLVQQAREIGPNKLFIAKWVDSPEQALYLFSTYHIDAAQGRNLPATLKDFVSLLRPHLKSAHA